MQNINDLICFIYPNLFTPDSQYLVEQAILISKNADVYTVNTIIMNQFPGGLIEYFSADTIEEQSDSTHQYPLEFLNSLNIGGLSPYKLLLKVGSAIILLCNIHPSDSLCNGTRLVCRFFQKHIIEAKIISKKHAGLHIFIPHIILLPSDSSLPFIFKWYQFPIQPAFAMTINKSQGQTLNWVGLYLPAPVFTYRQLYVAYLKVISRRNLA